MEKEKLIEKIKNSKDLRVYECGLYAKYESVLKRKYSEDRTPIELPENYYLIVLEKDL